MNVRLAYYSRTPLTSIPLTSALENQRIYQSVLYIRQTEVPVHVIAWEDTKDRFKLRHFQALTVLPPFINEHHTDAP